MKPNVKVRRFKGKRGEAKKVKVARTLSTAQQRSNWLTNRVNSAAYKKERRQMRGRG